MTKNASVINIGIIGPGRVAERHVNAINQINNGRLWSIAGRNIEDTQCFASKHNAQAEKNAFINISEMLSDPQLDAVIIATPDKLHVKHILLAVEANKSILVEKPLCTDKNDGLEILQALEKFNKTFAIGYHLRWHDGLRQIATKCRLSDFGKPRHLRLHWGVNFFDSNKWRTNPDYSRWLCLTVLGTHLIDVMRWLMVPQCGEILNSNSIVSNTHQTLFDETAVSSFQFESGATAQIFCSITLDAPFKLELYTDNTTVIGNDLAGDERSILIDNDPLIFKKNNPYIDQMNDFLRAIQENSKPEVGIIEGLKNIEHMLSIWQ